jgi:hypothetical protein
LGKRLGDWVLVRSNHGEMPRLEDELPDKAGRIFMGQHQLELRLAPGDELRVGCNSGGRWVAVRSKVYLAWPQDEAEPLRAEVRELVGAAYSELELDPPVPLPASGPGGAPPPKPGDWSKSVAVNTASPEERHADCDLRFLRGWGRLRCRAFGFRESQPKAALDVFGKEGEDYLVRIGGWMGEIVFRTQPGSSIRYEWGPYVGKPVLRVEWPKGADRPSVFAVEKKQP